MASRGIWALLVVGVVLTGCGDSETNRAGTAVAEATRPATAPTAAPTSSSPASWGLSVTDPREEPLMLAQDRFAPVLARHSLVNAGQVWDMGTGTLTFRLVDNAEGRKARAELAALHLPLRIRFETAARSTRELQAVAARLVATRATWAPGLSGFGYAVPDEVRGQLVLGVLDRYVAEWRTAVAAAHISVPVKVSGEAQVGVVWQ